VALRLAKEKAVIVCVARNKEKLDSVCALARKEGATDAHAYSCDISNTQQLTKTVNTIIKDL
jgi:short-subunit dehydrogenase